MIPADAPFTTEARLALIRGASSAAAGMVIEQASAMIRTYCGWHIWPNRPETATLTGYGPAALMLPSLYVTSIDTVTVDGTELAEGWAWDAAGTITYAGFTWPYSSVVVAFHSGYTEPLADLEALALGLSARLLASGKTGGATSTQVGGISVAYGTPGLAEHERWLLDRYSLNRRP